MRGALALTVVIVGGGPAGSAAAIRLAEGGILAQVLERTREPHDVVCGGFLGWDALARLRRLGIDPQALGAHQITLLRLVTRQRTVETRLPFVAAGLSRRRLDEALRARAATLGTTIERGVAVRACEGGVLRLDDGRTLTAGAILLATGKHELRGLARPRDPAAAAGLRTSFHPPAALAAALAGTIELHPFDGGYAGLLLQEDGTANLCLSTAPARLANGGVAGLLAALATEAPLLAERAAEAPADGWSAIAGVPYGFRARTTAPGLFRIGDQAAVIASLAGDGVAIALASGAGAAEALLRGGPDGAPAFQRRFARTAARPLAAAGAARRLVEHPRVRPLALGVLGAIPPLAGLIARATRIG